MARIVIASMLGLMLLALPAAAADPATPAASEGQKVQETMARFNVDLQALETESVSKAISLSADEATAFWPVFKRYQADQRQINDGQIAAVAKYADNYLTLSDEEAVAYVESLLARDQKIHDLRSKYLSEFSKVIGQKRAARVIHLCRKVGFASQARLAEAIPLIR